LNGPFGLEQYGLLISAALFCVLLGLEAVFPRKIRVLPRATRWRTNILLIVVDSLALRMMGPVVALAAAGWAAQNGIGIFHQINGNFWLELVCALILLDLAIYVQHVLTHKIALLWAIHKVHHADRDIDVTTALRFHPVEISLSMLYKVAIVIAIGPSILAVILFALLLNLCAMFNHSNLNLPQWMDALLRGILVTPDMHRVHHSTVPGETNSNYGSTISLWDKIFGTYRAQPAAGHDDVLIGLEEYQSDNPAKLWWSLILPFRRSASTENVTSDNDLTNMQ